MLSELIECGTTSLVVADPPNRQRYSFHRKPARQGKSLTAESAWIAHQATIVSRQQPNSQRQRRSVYGPEVLGVKIALGDHRSSTVEQVLHLLTDIRRRHDCR